MHRNTAILILVLAIIAALLIGLNIGKTINPQQLVPPPQPSAAVATALPDTQTTEYRMEDCGLSFRYSNDFSIETATQSARLNSKTNQNEHINIACATQIPRPPLLPELIQEATVAGRTVNVYHDASAQDGTPLDAVIFAHPTNGLDVAFLGFGEAFNQLLTTVKLLP
ncbi:hypothetical protein C4579_02490 [Candidatus Microgenomates bacterium]|nr:MAG: hypothetical protein C4579_02490 [Candidatus Microgenomates bacterium]